LTGVVQSAATLDPAVPTNTASAVVQVQNIGNQSVRQSQVGVYASLDTTLDASDVLLGTANTGQLNAGESKNVTTNLTIPNSLDALTYRLLAKLDNANTISENSEANNVAVGGTINVKWQFGTVPGRNGNTTLTLKDADGTTVTFGLSGPGLGEVIKDGANWDLKVTGTTASSAVTITTNSGGNGRVTLNDIHVFGPLSTFLAATSDLTGTLAIDGPVNMPGVGPGTLTLGSIQGGTVAVPSVEALTILGIVTNAKFHIGTTFGQDGQPGGAGANTDTYGAGTIGFFTVTGAMTGTSVRVGINPVDGIYGNGNDQLIGGTSSSIGGIVIGGTLSADTRFYAGAFPVQYLNGLRLKPTAGDMHFVSNFSAPSVSAALQQDTGASSSDGRTSNPAITGSVTDPQGVTTFTAGFGSSPTYNVLSDRQANGAFTFTRTRLEQINGGPLADGPYTLTLRATNGSGATTQATVAFSLDTQVPTLTVALDPSFDTAPVGDEQTTHATVTLTGQTEALAVVELVGLGRTATADAGGTYSFANVSLVAGANAFTVRATDLAGNQRTATVTITRLTANQPPLLNPIGNRTIDEGTELRFSISASDSDVPAQTLVYGVTGLPDGATFDQGTREFAWTPTEVQAPETYTVTFSVTDGVATAVETIDIVVNEVNVAPLLAPIGNRLVTEGSELRFTISANDTDLPIQAVIYNASGLPEGATFNTATREFAWTPSESQGPGTYSVTFTVTDGFASDSETIAIEVVDTNAAPALVPIGNKTVLEGDELRFTISGSDGDVPAQTLVYSAVGLPQGAAFDPATHEFVWTPSALQGSNTYTVTFSVSDGLLSSSEAITITVTDVNQSPVLNAIGDRSATEGSLLTFQASVTDADVPAQAMAYALEDGIAGAIPAGASIDPSSGVFSWAPTEGQGPGTYIFDVVVTDNGTPALSDRETITVTVNEVNLAPGLSVPVAVSGDEQSLVTFTAVGTDGDQPANQLTFSLQGTVPGGASIDPGTGVFTWTPTEAQGPGVYDITVRVTDNGTPSAFSEQVVRLTIGDANQSPTITSASSVAVPENQTAIMTVTASDADIPAQSLTFSVTGGADAAAVVFTTGGELSFVTAPNFEAPSDANHDNVYEVAVQVSDGAGGIATQNVNITVTNVVENVPTLSISDVTLAEGTSVSGATAFNFVVTLSEPVNETVTVQVATADNGATAASGDYTPVLPTTLTFGPGETTKSVTVQVRQDDRVEGTEQFQVSLSAPTNATILDGAGFGTITNDDVRTLSINDVTQTEGTSPAGFTAYTFTVTLSAPTLTSDVTVLVATSDNGATAASGDYTPVPPTTVTFGPNQTEQTVTVQVRQDDRVEGNEQFQVSLSAPTNATILDGAGFGTITNDDVRTLSVDDVTQTEGTSPAGFTAYTFTVTLSAPTLTSDVTVLVATSDNGATAASGDYTPVPPTTLTFGPNQTEQTVTVQVRQDDRVEGTEQFQVSLSAPTNATILDGAGFGTILDDDVRSVSIDDVTVTEGDSGTKTAVFTVTLSQSSPTIVSVVATTVADTATPGSDYTTLSQSLTFAPGTTQQTFSVSIINDLLLEPTEQFFVDLSNVTSGVVIADAQSIGTILDNDINQAPQLAPIGNQTVNEGQLLQFNANATDPDGPTAITFSLDNGVGGQVPSGASINALGTFTWTPTEAQGPGSYTFDVIVTDGGTPTLSTRETITIAVAEVNRAPILQAISDQTVTAGQQLTFTAVGIDFDLPVNTPASNLIYSLDLSDLPPGYGTLNTPAIDPSTGVFTWTPAEGQVGAQVITVRVENELSDGLFAGQDVRFNVESANHAPELNPITDQTITEGETLTLTAVATDPDAGQVQVFSLPNAPSGAQISSISGEFSWNPTEAQGPGIYQVTVAVSDGMLTTSKTFSVTVNEVNVAPTLNSIGNKTVNEETELRFAVSGVDVDQPEQILMYRATDLPTGSSFDSASREFIWTPTAAQGPGSYSVTFSVTDGIATTSETISIAVTAVNHAPVADGLTLSVVQNVDTSVVLTGSDVENDSLSFLIVNGPQHGTLSGAGSTRTYTSDSGYTGQDSFTFKVNDGQIDSNIATVTITVTPAVAGVHWINAAGGDWNVASNWSTGAIPTATEDVFIDLAGAYTITHSTGTTQVKSLQSEHQINLTGGTLTVTEPIQMNGAVLSLGGGTLKNSTVMGSGVNGRVMEVVGSGTLDAATLEDTDSVINVYVAPGAQLTIVNGLILNGGSANLFSGVELIVEGGTVVASTPASGSQTIGGTSGVVVLRGGGSITSPGATLILRPDIGLLSERGAIGSPDGGIVLMGTTSVVGNGGLDTVNVRNLGHIQITGKVGPLDVGGALTGTGFFSNEGSIEAQNGSFLAFENFDNIGAIRILQPGLNPVVTFTMTGTNPLFNHSTGTIHIWNDLTMVLNGSLYTEGRVFTGQEVAPDSRGVLDVSGDVTIANSSGAGIWLQDGELKAQGKLLNLGMVNLGTGYMQVGDYTEEQGSTLSTNLGSLTDFGRLDIDGAATLNGSLSVVVTGTLTIGDRYRFMTFDSRTNSFENLLLPATLALDDTDPGFLELMVVA